MKKVLLAFADGRFLAGFFLCFPFDFQRLQGLLDDLGMCAEVLLDGTLQFRCKPRVAHCRFGLYIG